VLVVGVVEEEVGRGTHRPGWNYYGLTHFDNFLCIFHTVLKVHPNFSAKFPSCELHAFSLDSFGDTKTLLLSLIFSILDTASTVH